MPNTIRLGPATSVQAPDPAPRPGRVLVQRVHAFVPPALSAGRTGPRRTIGLLRRRYPRAIRKLLAYLWTEGVGQTWTKVRSRADLERLAASASAFAAVGTVVHDARGTWTAGQPVLCWGWAGPLDADVHMVAPEQCLPIPDVDARYARAPFIGWIAGVVRMLPGPIASCVVIGLDATVNESISALVPGGVPGGRNVVVTCGADDGRAVPGAYVVRLSSERAVHPLVDVGADSATARLADPAHYFLDPHYPGPLELPGPFARSLVEDALAFLVARHEGPAGTAPSAPPRTLAFVLSRPAKRRPPARVCVSCLGAGNYVRAVLVHHLRRATSVRVRGVMDVRPEVAARQAEALDAEFSTTEAAEVVADPATDVVLIASDHASHASYAIAALRARKVVHLEKPPAVTREQLAALIDTIRSADAPRLHLGYNRPYAPAVVALQRHLDQGQGPVHTHSTVHGYRLGRAHWYRWPNEGTRVAGNLVHWIDLGYRLNGRRRPVRVDVLVDARAPSDVESLGLYVEFDGGGTTKIDFSAGGDETYGIEETIEVRREGLTAVIDDFRSLTVDLGGRRRRWRHGRDKGHAANVAALTALATGAPWSTDVIDDLLAVGTVQFAAEEALAEGGGRVDLV